ncbi:M13 family metallopeptidase [Spiroplasma endosymbiont of Crioceris asparagi]|uniref:M13 family metallopeptidase n=1 Tax=Spiroplasma endosymbiont of Crioceris asparagi TaxID=3066286 RepID=UPI0030D521BA
MKNKPLLQDDFYEALNWEWLKETKIPTGYSSWGAFEELHKQSVDNVGLIIDELITNKHKYLSGSDELKIVNLYNNFIDFKSRNKVGLKPIEPILNHIKEFKDIKDLTNLLIYLSENFESGLFSISVEQDLKDSQTNILYIGSVSLGMGTRDYYTKDDDHTKQVQNAYKNYLKALLLLNDKTISNPEVIVDRIYEFETKLALATLTPVEKRDPLKLYNIFTIDDFKKHTPIIEWARFFKARELDCARKFVVEEPDFMTALNKTIQEVDIETFKYYLITRIIGSNSNSLTEELWKIGFEYSKSFSGVKEPKPLRERAIAKVEAYLGELIGKEYVKKHFSKEAKDDVIKMIKQMFEVYKKRIANLEWMGETTKKAAIKKLETFNLKIGFPNKWEDFSDVEIKTFAENSNLYENALSVAKHERKIALKELQTGKVDPDKWYMNPQEVNAYYNPTENVIVFPAAILQEPFYDIKNSKGKNHGGIGVVIGHEIVHGFDDEGSKFDENGNLNNWWTAQDRELFDKLTKRLADRYSEFSIEGVNLNGELTLGENIADLGGVVANLEIIKKHYPDEIKEFFEAYGRIWKTKCTPEYAKYLVNIDPHSPGKYRVNGILENIDEFFEVYNIQENHKMYKSPQNRIKIW